MTSTGSNPFFHKYDTPHGTVPFGSFTLRHIEEAMMEGMQREKEQMERICSNTAEPTFDNTIIYDDEKEDGYYDLLDRASTVFFNILSADTDDEWDALANKMSPLLTQHSNDLRLNPVFFKRVKAVYDAYNGTGETTQRELSPEEKKLLEDTYMGLVRSGALLDEKGQETLRKLTEEAGLLSLQFSQNLLKEKKAYKLLITDERQLDGLPQTAIDAAAAAAREEAKSRTGVVSGNDNGNAPAEAAKSWLFTLDYPSWQPFMTYSTQRELRREMYMAYNTVCTHDNAENNLAVCSRLINIRREIAQLLGYEDYASYVLERRMADSPQKVYDLLDRLIESYKPAAIEEGKALEAMAKRMEGDGFEMQPWDKAFYAHKLKLAEYDIDAEMLRPYLQLENVVKGVFGLATTLYGITFREDKDIPVYHPDVKAYEVMDADGSFLAVLYADFFPRKGKRGGAWMTEYQSQYIRKSGENVRPHVSIVTNFTKPTEDKPALLTLGEVETLLHEFGHALHGMFANTRFASLSGTNVLWDFVELPSQFMENYAVEADFLRTFAVHHETGECIPDHLIERIVKARNFNVAMSCLRQVSFGLLDMAYYTQKREFAEDIMTFEKEAWAPAVTDRQLAETCMTVQFSHIISGGYAAGYYSYKWAEVLDADAFAVFRREGIFNRETAQRFRDCILSKGGTEHPMTLFVRFKGSEPSIDALMERNGITRK